MPAKTALVTGGSGALGAAICRRLYREGWQVAIGSRSRPEAARALCAELGAGTLPLCFDVTARAEVEAAVEQTRRSLGPVDLLVVCAGTALWKPFADTSPAEWEGLLSLHMTGAFHCAQAVLPDMLRQQAGSIVLISSIWGQVGASCEVAYSAAKGGLIAFSRALAKELGPSGIRVNCVCPGVIDTPMNQGFGQAALAELAEETPLGRLGTPAEVAAAVAFLAGEDAAFITGETLGVGGGFAR